MEDQVHYYKWGYSLMRFTVKGNGLYEDRFDIESGQWQTTTDLSGPFYKGDTDLIELTEEEAREFQPAAFLNTQKSGEGEDAK